MSFALAHEAKPVELAGEVSRIFLGVQIQCAQCHDHKTDSWKREQFHEFAAFFSGVGPGRMSGACRGSCRSSSVVVAGAAAVHDARQGQPRPSRSRSPRKFFLAARRPDATAPREPATRRAAGRWGPRTSPGQDNPWFARAFVNRIWYVLMGESFYDAVDDLGPERTPKAREVIERSGRRSGRRGDTTSAGSSGRSPTRRLPAAGPLDGQPGRQDGVRVELSQPAPLRPDRRGPDRGAGIARRPDPRRQRRGPRRPRRAAWPSRRRGQKKPGNAKKAVAGRRAGRRPAAAKGQAKARPPGRPAAALQRPLRRRSVDPQRRRPGDDSPGPLPHEQPDDPQPDPGPAREPSSARSWRRPPTTGPPSTPSTSGSCPGSPTPKEVETCAHYLGKVGNRAEAFEDIYWALINSTEFISRR